MTIYTSYKVKIKKDDGDTIACYRAFEDTVIRYRQAVDFFLYACREHPRFQSWDERQVFF